MLCFDMTKGMAWASPVVEVAAEAEAEAAEVRVAASPHPQIPWLPRVFVHGLLSSLNLLESARRGPGCSN